MQKEIILSAAAPAPIGPYSQAVKVNGTLYVSGTIALDAASGNMVQDSIQAETRKVLDNLGEVLKAAGMNYSNIVKATIFITNMNQFAEINEVYAGYFPQQPPARETVQVSKLPKGANVEISVIAVE